MMGLNPCFKPRFLKQFGNLRNEALQAAKQYITEVQDGEFPAADHSH
jgi:ketopantoate hydroxymethyltransferase